MKKYCVYMHTNIANGKRYVGITCQKPGERFEKFGTGYKANKPFYEDIKRYGWDFFKHEIMAQDLEEDDARRLEMELIQKYCTRSDGYNRTDGGEIGGFTSVLNADANFLKRTCKKKLQSMTIPKGCTTPMKIVYDELCMADRNNDVNEGDFINWVCEVIKHRIPNLQTEDVSTFDAIIMEFLYILVLDVWVSCGQVGNVPCYEAFTAPAFSNVNIQEEIDRIMSHAWAVINAS